MAKEAKPAATEIGPGGPGEKPAKKGGKLLWIVIGVVILGGGGAAALLLTGHKATAKPAEEVAADAPAAAAPAVPHAPPIYYKFDPAFVVNFGSEGNSRYLQITVETMSRDPAVIEEIKTNEPAIRNDLVLLFSGQQYDGLITQDGKDRLRQATLEAIRKTVAAEGVKGELVEGVYFTSFVIQ
jgi:flagellar FliL protein